MRGVHRSPVGRTASALLFAFVVAVAPAAPSLANPVGDPDALAELLADDGAEAASLARDTEEAELPGGSHVINDGDEINLRDEDLRLSPPYHRVGRPEQDLENPFDEEDTAPAVLAAPSPAARPSAVAPGSVPPPAAAAPSADIRTVEPSEFPVRSVFSRKEPVGKRRTGVNY